MPAVREEAGLVVGDGGQHRADRRRPVAEPLAEHGDGLGGRRGARRPPQAYELALESTRQPDLAEAMARLGAGALGSTLAEHRSLGLPTTAEQVQALIALYNGTLMTLVVAPPGTVTPEATLGLARCLVSGVLRPQGDR